MLADPACGGWCSLVGKHLSRTVEGMLLLTLLVVVGVP